MTKCPGGTLYLGKWHSAHLSTPAWTDHFLLIQFPPTKLILLEGGFATKHNGQHPFSQTPRDSAAVDLHRPLGIRGTNQQLWNLSFQRQSQRAHWLLIQINGTTTEEQLVRNCFLQTGLKIASSAYALWYLRGSWGKRMNWQTLHQEESLGGVPGCR